MRWKVWAEVGWSTAATHSHGREGGTARDAAMVQLETALWGSEQGAGSGKHRWRAAVAWARVHGRLHAGQKGRSTGGLGDSRAPSVGRGQFWQREKRSEEGAGARVEGDATGMACKAGQWSRANQGLMHGEETKRLSDGALTRGKQRREQHHGSCRALEHAHKKGWATMA